MTLIETGLGFLGVVVISSLAFALCGMAVFVVVTIIANAIHELLAELYKIRFFKALKDISSTACAGLFGGVCLGAAFALISYISIPLMFNIPMAWMFQFSILRMFDFSIKSMFNFSTLTLTGAMIGFLAGIAIGIYRVSQIWNRCYLCENGTYKGIEIEACKLCERGVPVGKP